MELPYYITQQYTKGLGDTVDELTDILGKDYYEKITFSACKSEEMPVYSLINTPNVLVIGMETHICVLQTVIDLLDYNYKVFVVADAVMSRTKENWKTGLKYINDAGAMITSTEIALFQTARKELAQKNLKRFQNWLSKISLNYYLTNSVCKDNIESNDYFYP